MADDEDGDDGDNVIPIARAPPLRWPGGTYKNGASPKPNMLNARTALLRLGCRCSYNLFKHRFMVNGPREKRLSRDRVVNLDIGEIDDNAITRLRDYISATFLGFDPLDQPLLDAIKNLGLQHEFHPVIDYLDTAPLDKSRSVLDIWLIKTFNAEDSDYVRAVCRLSLIAAVCRVRVPGCKYDTAPVLVARQGIAKSGAIRILAVKDEWFTDQPILALDARTQMERMTGQWLYEIADLDGMKRAETAHVKAFMSRQYDNARMAYGRIAESRPRQCVFFATTNETKFLKDDTGNRRWWPIVTKGEANLIWLEANRDQLWAEANERAKALISVDGTMKHDALSLPRDLWPVAEAVQLAHMIDEPWADEIAAKLHSGSMFRKRYFSTEIASFLDVPIAQRNNLVWIRIGNAMRQNDFIGPFLMRKRDENDISVVGRGFAPREDQREPMEEPDPMPPPQSTAPTGGNNVGTKLNGSPPVDDDVPF